jgi:hypothetical protein
MKRERQTGRQKGRRKEKKKECRKTEEVWTGRIEEKKGGRGNKGDMEN